MSRKLITSILVYGTALGLGIGFGAESSVLRPKPVQAVCYNGNTPCYNDGTKTSLLTVQHVEAGVGAILPSGSTTWDITANWSQANPLCGDDSETASATVTWDSSTASWVLSNVNLTNNINQISLCNGAGCNPTASTYTLYVDINNFRAGGGGYQLRAVDYDTSSVPNGTQCVGGASRTPVSSTASATDSGFNSRCAYDCSHTGFPVITNYYQ